MVRHAILASACSVLFLATTVDALSLRGGSETWSLLSGQSSAPSTEQPLQEKSISWVQTNANDAKCFHTNSTGKVEGDHAILVFHDRTVNATLKAEAALVTFDVRSNANCVVSVCGTMRNWYMGSSEQCWGLKIAPKSSDPKLNGLIRGISAAYTATRPVANKMYLKFDAINYIDGSACHYEVLSGTKTVTTESVVAQE